MARANSIITTTVGASTITFAVKGAGELILDMEKVSDDVATRAAHHGLIQRISDAAALSRNTDTGQPASPADKLEAMRRLVDHYNSGTADWALRAAGGEGKEGGITLRAVAAVQGVDVATMRTRLEELATKKETTTRALLAKLATQPAVAAKIAEMRGPAAVDADALMGELA
jgi:hypothetical protein